MENMKSITLDQGKLEWLERWMRNTVVPLDDFNQYFSVLAAVQGAEDVSQDLADEEDLPSPAVAQPVPTPAPAPVPATPTTEPSSDISFDGGNIISRRELSDRFMQYVVAAGVPASEINTIMVETPEGYFVLANGIVVKVAGPEAGTCIEFVSVEEELHTDLIIPTHMQNNVHSSRVTVRAVGNSHYTISKAGHHMEIDRYTADVLVAFMRYHRATMGRL